MAQVDKEDIQALLGFYAHISRIYSSSVNAAIAVIFGWLAFFGFSMTISSQLFHSVNVILISVGCVMFFFGFYFYLRIWLHGKYLVSMIKDFGLGDYVKKLPRFRFLTWLNERPVEQPTNWTPGEKIGLIFLVLSFIIPLIILALR